MVDKAELQYVYQWWLGQLKQVVPEKIRSWFLVREGHVALELSQKQLTVSRYEESAEAKPPERESFTLDEVEQDQLPNLIMHGFDRRMTQVTLRLSANQVLRKRIQVPIALAENLKEALSYDLDRYTPFKPEQIYFDAFVLPQEGNSQTLDVLLAVVARKNVQALLRQVNDWGIDVDHVQMAGCRMPGVPGAEEFSPKFLSEEMAPERNKTKGRLNLIALGVCSVLMVACLALPLWQQQQVLRSLKSEVSKAQKEAKIATDTRNQLSQIVENANYLVKQKKQAHTALALLSEMTKLLPNDSYLTLMELKNGTVRMQGQSVDAAKLISKVEASTYFQGAKINGQLTKDRKTGLQRFYLTANVIEAVK